MSTTVIRSISCHFSVQYNLLLYILQNSVLYKILFLILCLESIIAIFLKNWYSLITYGKHKHDFGVFVLQKFASMYGANILEKILVLNKFENQNRFTYKHQFSSKPVHKIQN